MIDSLNSYLRVGSNMADIYNNHFFVAYQHALLSASLSRAKTKTEHETNFDKLSRVNEIEKKAPALK